MSGYVDIHAHVLPGIDDGPSEIEESLAMARAAVESGITTIAVTPHLHPGFPDVQVHELADRCQELREAIERAKIPLRVVSGAEVSLTWALDAGDEELRLASYGQRGTDLLIETPASNVIGLDRFLYELRAHGYRITLAHPERARGFSEHESALRNLVEQGVLLQINAESLLGPSTRGGLRRFARHLCSEGLMHVLASDGHRASRWRPVTVFGRGVEAVWELVGEERAQWLAVSAPQAVIEGAELPPAPPITAQRRSWWRAALGH